MPEKRIYGPKLNLYLPEGFGDDLEKLIILLTERGVDLYDARGAISVSRLFRYLVEKELCELESDPEDHRTPAPRSVISESDPTMTEREVHVYGRAGVLSF